MADTIMTYLGSINLRCNLCADYPCLYDVGAASFKNRDVRQLAMEEIGSNYENHTSTPDGRHRGEPRTDSGPRAGTSPEPSGNLLICAASPATTLDAPCADAALKTGSAPNDVFTSHTNDP